jgi:hypothetical protein
MMLAIYPNGITRRKPQHSFWKPWRPTIIKVSNISNPFICSGFIINSANSSPVTSRVLIWCVRIIIEGEFFNALDCIYLLLRTVMFIMKLHWWRAPMFKVAKTVWGWFSWFCPNWRGWYHSFGRWRSAPLPCICNKRILALLRHGLFRVKLL